MKNNQIVYFLMMIFFLSHSMAGVCTSPTGSDGQLKWVAAENKIKWCNGSVWVDTTNEVISSCSGVASGTINYASGAYRYCNGTNWINMKGALISSCAGIASGTLNFNSSTIQMRMCDGTNWYKIETAATACTVVKTIFNYTGAVQTFTQSSGCTKITIKAWGAGGGNAFGGGAGGYATGILNLAPGSTINIYVGGTSASGNGWNGGGTGGGGATDVRVGGIALSNRVIVAGGGGNGTDSVDAGGAGGGLTGQSGTSCGAPVGTGGSQTAGGSVGGSLGIGGANGGGGGYYGGGTGGFSDMTGCGPDVGGDGGGSSYIGGVTSATTLSGNYGTPGNSSDSDRATAGSPANAGRIVITTSP